MQKQFWWQSLARITLWSHVVGVVGFYLYAWQRTLPKDEDRLKKLPLRKNIPAFTAAEQGKEPTVSIIVPARNEENNIARCIRSLLEQDYSQFEVIAVDDGSTDKTEQILDELAHTHPQGNRLWVLRLRDELPAGWAGKPHALHLGVQEAQGEWLLFTDADTWHAPNALRSVITQAVQEGMDLFTVGTQQELPTFWERVLMPMAYLGISMQYPPRLVNDPKSKVAIANGQYLLIRKTVYEFTGGYARPDLRSTLLDDRDLARVVKSNGFKLHFVDGRDLIHVHMYRGLRDTWRGWRKNAYLGSRGGLPFVLLELFGLPMITIVPFLLPLLARLTTHACDGSGIGSEEATTASVVELLPLLLYRLWLNNMLRVPWYYAFTHPLAGVIFEGILGESTWRILTHKGVDWRGRQYNDGKTGMLNSLVTSKTM
ncbi:MAG: hydroxychlorobactene glucosyltransferase CruC [Ktedonobacteraceae bacterium]